MPDVLDTVCSGYRLRQKHAGNALLHVGLFAAEQQRNDESNTSRLPGNWETDAQDCIFGMLPMSEPYLNSLSPTLCSRYSEHEAERRSLGPQDIGKTAGMRRRLGDSGVRV